MKFDFPPALILAAVLVPAAIALYCWTVRDRIHRLARVIAPRLREQLTQSVNFRKRRLKAVLFAAGLVSLCIALARPQLGWRMKEIERTSVDFMVALDLSGSMLAEDAQDGESRLKAAKDGLNHFIDNLGEDRLGLIAFAGKPIVAAPVTQDHEAVKRNLAALDTKSIADQGTDIAAAIQLAEKTFSAGDFESKALVILTDGEELQGDAVIAARAASAKGMSIFTVSVGSTRGARIPRQERTGDPIAFARNEFGHEVLTRVNERVLRQIAANGHGFFQPLGKDGEGLQQVYERGLQPLGRGTRLKPSNDLLDRFQWPLAFAIGLLLTECMVNDRRHLSTTPRK